MRRSLLAMAVALTASGAAAQSAGQWKDPARVWAASCGYCHGAAAIELRGRGLPPRVIMRAMRRGMPGMPAFHPSEIDDRELAQFARWLSASPAPAAAAGRP